MIWPETFLFKKNLGAYLIITIVTVSQILYFTGCDSFEKGIGIQLEPDYSAFEVFSPHKVKSGQILPVVIYMPYTNPRINQKQVVMLSALNACFNSISLKRGMGSQLVRFEDLGWCAGDSSVLNVNVINEMGITAEVFQIRIIDNFTSRELSGVLSHSDLIWDSTEVIHITDNLTIPVGCRLRIEPGTIVELGENASVLVEGSVSCTGTRKNPVIFTSDSLGLPWGEIYHRNSANYYSYTFFTNGGGDDSRPFGHSESQPVVSGTDCEVFLDHAFIIDNPGKAFGFTRSEVHLDSCLISRCDTGGEFRMTIAKIKNCYFMDIPNDDGVEIDDDNDGLYLVLPWNDGDSPSILENCVFMEGKDDGIDHNGANVVIKNCVVDGFDNEGIATSNRNTVQIVSTLVTNCEQGIEAGYGLPQVSIDHCLLINNETGIRFGDWYNRECDGFITITNTISVNNSLHNVWNHVVLEGGPEQDAITISYSLVNEEEYNREEGCITGNPEFTLDYLLTDDSPGKNAASDSSDIGLFQ